MIDERSEGQRVIVKGQINQMKARGRKVMLQVNDNAKVRESSVKRESVTRSIAFVDGRIREDRNKGDSHKDLCNKTH